MSPDLNQDMVDGMDDTAGLLPPHKPAARTSAFYWQGQPSEIAPLLRPSSMARTTEPKSYSYPVEGREAGEKSSNKRQALVRGGI